MRDKLLEYYERELRFIRRQTEDFATSHPAIAEQLLLKGGKCDDPHVERLIEAFAMLTARVQMRLDDEFPQLTEALLDALHPHCLAPVPSATIVQFAADPERSGPTACVHVDRHTLLNARAVANFRCRFRTVYPVSLWPIELSEVRIERLSARQPGLPEGATAALRLRLRTQRAQSFRELAIGRLRFYLHSESSPALVHGLYELLLRKPLGVLVRFPARTAGGAPSRSSARGAEDTKSLSPRAEAPTPNAPPVLLGPEQVRPVGFGADEGLLENVEAGHLGHRLLQEYFCFPEKFHFVEIGGLDADVLAPAGEDLEVLVLLDHMPLELEDQVKPENLKLGCTPAVNLFLHRCDQLELKHTVSEYQVQPDKHAPLAYEVITIQEVESLKSGPGGVRSYRPFYALRHGDPRTGERAFWQATRRLSRQPDDAGTEVFLTLVDPDGRQLATPPEEYLAVDALCSNRDMAALLPLGQPNGDFQVEGKPGVTRVTALRRPTPPLRATGAAEQQWRLLSLLQLNYLSLLGPPTAEAAPGDGGAMTDPKALRELLSLLDVKGDMTNRQRISGLAGLRTRRVLRRVTVEGQRVFARGLEVTVELDESKFTGSGVYLFASLLERFLGLYTGINSFSQTIATVRQREEVLKRWPPRAGDIQLL